MPDYASAGGPLGLQGGSTIDRLVKNLTGGPSAAGNVVMMNEAAASTAIGDPDGSEGSFIEPAVNEQQTVYARFGICLEDIDAGELGMIRFRGRVTALVRSEVGNILVSGIQLAPNNGQVFLETAASNDKVVAIMKDIDVAAGQNTALRTVEFDGLNGFGRGG